MFIHCFVSANAFFQHPPDFVFYVCQQGDFVEIYVLDIFIPLALEFIRTVIDIQFFHTTRKNR